MISAGCPSLIASAGIRLHPAYYADFLKNKQPVAWIEIQAENFLNVHAPAYHTLSHICQHYPVSLHSVNLSVGSSDGIDKEHVRRVKDLADQLCPFSISEHLSWGRLDGYYVNAPLPLPYTRETLDVCASNIDQIQNMFERPILIENPVSSFQYGNTHMEEADFITVLVNRTGSGILLNLDNLYVSCRNHNWNAESYLQTLPSNKVQKISLAGHSFQGGFLHDTNRFCANEEVWRLYRRTLALFNPLPTLIGWDKDIPELKVLLKETAKIQALLEDQSILRESVKVSHVSIR